MVGANIIRCGHLTIRPIESSRKITAGQTVSKDRSAGSARVFEVTNHNDVAMEVAVVRWNTGQADARAIGEIEGSMALRRLERGALRMSVMDPDKHVCWVELSQARMKPGTGTKHSNLFKVTLTELNEGCGLDAHLKLTSAGALGVGSKEVILKHDDNRRFYLCATFERGNSIVPIVAYVITRVLPLINEYSVN